MENTNLKRLAAMCAAAASLSTLGLAGTAMAVETPTTADTATASITLNAAQGNTLAGHTFTFYRLGSYGDITANGDKDVKSLTVNKIDDASDKWIAAANAKAGITDLQGFDAAGDLAHVGKDGEPTGTVQGQLREAAKQLAASASASKIQAVKSVAGEGDTMTVSDLPNGLYLIIDSDGVPMIVGTPIQGTKTLNGVTLGTLTVKSKTTKIDKKVSRDRLNKGTFIDSKAGDTEDSASFTVGETVDFKYVFTLPNMQAATQTVVKDTMNGLTLAGDPAFSIDGKTVTPSVAKGENSDGFTATFDQAFIKANSAKKVTVTYKAVVANAKRAAQASNTAAISTTFYDGTAASKTTVDSNDTATVSAYDVNIKKTNWDGRQGRLQDPEQGHRQVDEAGSQDRLLDLRRHAGRSLAVPYRRERPAEHRGPRRGQLPRRRIQGPGQHDQPRDRRVRHDHHRRRQGVHQRRHEQAHHRPAHWRQQVDHHREEHRRPDRTASDRRPARQHHDRRGRHRHGRRRRLPHRPVQAPPRGPHPLTGRH